MGYPQCDRNTNFPSIYKHTVSIIVCFSQNCKKWRESHSEGIYNSVQKYFVMLF